MTCVLYDINLRLRGVFHECVRADQLISWLELAEAEDIGALRVPLSPTGVRVNVFDDVKADGHGWHHYRPAGP